MNRLSLVILVPLVALAWAPAATLADEVAAERARLANQRIQAEEERRAREAAEQTQADQEEQQQAEAKAAPPPSASRIEMSRALEQLRELGALRDAGYLTDDEFQLLKKKILDAAL